MVFASFIYIFIYVFWLGGHIQWGSWISPGSVFRNYSWQGWETNGMLGTERRWAACKTKDLFAVLSLWPLAFASLSKFGTSLCLNEVIW